MPVCLGSCLQSVIMKFYLLIISMLPVQRIQLCQGKSQFKIPFNALKALKKHTHTIKPNTKFILTFISPALVLAEWVKHDDVIFDGWVHWYHCASLSWRHAILLISWVYFFFFLKGTGTTFAFLLSASLSLLLWEFFPPKLDRAQRC